MRLSAQTKPQPKPPSSYVVALDQFEGGLKWYVMTAEGWRTADSIAFYVLRDNERSNYTVYVGLGAFAILLKVRMDESKSVTCSVYTVLHGAFEKVLDAEGGVCADILESYQKD